MSVHSPANFRCLVVISIGAAVTWWGGDLSAQAPPNAGAAAPLTPQLPTPPVLTAKAQGQSTSGQAAPFPSQRTTGSLEGQVNATTGLGAPSQDARRLGVSADSRLDVDSTRAADLGLWFSTAAGTKGLTISDIAAEGAITSVGFQENDRIISINGTPVNTEAEFMRALLSLAGLNQQASVVVSRNGQQQTLTLQPATLIQGMAVADPFLQYGMTLNTSDPNRITVERVFPRTPAFYAGLRAGDVITGANGQPLTSAAAFSQALQGASGSLGLQISRNNQTRNVNLLLGQAGVQSGTPTAVNPLPTRNDPRFGSPAVNLPSTAVTPAPTPNDPRFRSPPHINIPPTAPSPSPTPDDPRFRSPPHINIPPTTPSPSPTPDDPRFRSPPHINLPPATPATPIPGVAPKLPIPGGTPTAPGVPVGGGAAPRVGAGGAVPGAGPGAGGGAGTPK